MSMVNESKIKEQFHYFNIQSDVDSVYGKLIIKGNDLEVTVIDIDKGDLKLKGTIDSIVYSNIKSKPFS